MTHHFMADDIRGVNIRLLCRNAKQILLQTDISLVSHHLIGLSYCIALHRQDEEAAAGS